jgi:macrodomain Ter protein organizer (MatP/YcbG family)
MSKAKFKIDDKQKSYWARSWIHNQFNNYAHKFPYDDWELVKESKNEFLAIKANSFKQLNTWCEKHLKSEDWKKLKGSIRANRLRAKRGMGEKERIVRVDLTENAHIILSSMADSYGVTLSEVIVRYMEKDWLKKI